MKLSDKIVRLRKTNGMSQEELADKLGVSRQAISRWEMGAAMPDATNILQLSRLFQVTTDYLLNDEYQSDNDLPKVKEVKTDGIHQIMIFLITLEVMVLIIQLGTDTAKTESKTAQAQMLIWELLANGKCMPSAELEKAVNERGISSRTMRTAKSRIVDRLVTEKDGTAWVYYLRD